MKYGLPDFDHAIEYTMLILQSVDRLTDIDLPKYDYS